MISKLCQIAAEGYRGGDRARENRSAPDTWKVAAMRLPAMSWMPYALEEVNRGAPHPIQHS